MDYMERREERKKAVKDQWQNLVRALQDAVKSWNDKHPGWSPWECGMDRSDPEHRFWVATKPGWRLKPDAPPEHDALGGHLLNCVLVESVATVDGATVNVGEGGDPEDVRYRISVADDGAYLHTGDRKKVSVEEAAFEILEPFLEKYK
jgi:hypothetical protein